MYADELVHVVKHIAAQSSIEQRPWVYGHISTYDPLRHAVRVIVPSMRDDQTGDPLVSGWLQLGSGSVGGGSGLQVFPVGGATVQNPTAGEQCMVAINDRGTGVAAVVCLFYSNVQQPPNTVVPTRGRAGDILWRHQTGTLQWFHDTGTVEVTTAADGAVSISVSGAGNISLTSSGSGRVVVTAAQSEVDVVAQTVNITGSVAIVGSLTVTGDITAGQGTTNQVGVRTHTHGRGTPAAGTTPPSAGT